MLNTILITGSTDGIGLATAEIAARHGNQVILHGRNEAKGLRVLKKLKEDSGNINIHYYNADFGSLKEVADLAKTLSIDFPRIDILINNAAEWLPQRQLGKEGHELTFTINFLAPFLLTEQLTMLLDFPIRNILNVAAMVHANTLDIDSMESRPDYSAWGAYAKSKLYLIMLSYFLSDKYKNHNTVVNAVHPGVVSTNMLAATGSHVGESRENAGERIYRLVTDEKYKNVAGKFFANLKEVESATISYNRSAQQKVYNVAEALTKPFQSEN